MFLFHDLNFKEAACGKGVFKRKASFQALSQHCNEKWIRLILGLLIRVPFSSTLFSNCRDYKQFRSFHGAILTIWYVYCKRWNNLHLTFLLTIVIINYVVLIIIHFCSNKILSALFNSIIIFSNAEYTLLLSYNKLILEPGFLGNY